MEWVCGEGVVGWWCSGGVVEWWWREGVVRVWCIYLLVPLLVKVPQQNICLLSHDD